MSKKVAKKKTLNFFSAGKIQCLKQRMLFFQQSNAVTRIYSTDNSVLYLTSSFLVRPGPLLKALGGALT